MQRQDAVLWAMKDRPISQRRACVVIGVDPKTMRREHPSHNPEIRPELNKITQTPRRFGYRRIGVMLECKGMVMNEKKLYRIYRTEGSSVRRKGGRTPMPVPLRPNQLPLSADCFAIACRSMACLDFLSDRFGACWKFRMLAVNDDFGRENLGLITDTLTAAMLLALPTAKYVLTEHAYDAEWFRCALMDGCIKPCILRRKLHAKPLKYDKRRNRITLG